MLRCMSIGLSRGLKPFLTLAPSPISAVKIRGAQTLVRLLKTAWDLAKVARGQMDVTEILGKELAGVALRPVKRLPKRAIARSLQMAQIRGKRTLLDPVIQNVEEKNGRVVRRMRVMYHDANKAKKHLDVHIGRTSLIYRVSGKPVENEIRYNYKGELTEASKKALLEHLRSEIAQNARVAQNLDHTIANAKCSWLVGEPGISGYGSGLTRQLVTEGDVELYHRRVRSSEHIYVPQLFGSQGTYLYQIYPGTDTGVPILIWGKLIPRDERYKDRLHLKLVQPEELETTYQRRIDERTNTRKYDGASTYFSSNGEGFKFFSPRYSKETGRRIEYTYKVPELCEQGHRAKPAGMGELMFWRRSGVGRLLYGATGLRGPEHLCWDYVPASEVGGILNGDSVRPREIHPEVRIYRIDRWNGIDTYSFPFFANRELQEALRAECRGAWEVVARARPVRGRVSNGWEGFVGVPEGGSVNDGLKVKWWGDEADWEVIGNDLSLSEKGNIQGVLRFRSLESGREYNLGPGQIGSFDDCMLLLDAKQDAIGLVAKVHSRQGHEGRASKLVSWHLDKGQGHAYFSP